MLTAIGSGSGWCWKTCCRTCLRARLEICSGCWAHWKPPKPAYASTRATPTSARALPTSFTSCLATFYGGGTQRYGYRRRDDGVVQSRRTTLRICRGNSGLGRVVGDRLSGGRANVSRAADPGGLG